MLMYKKGSDKGITVEKGQREVLIKAGWTDKPEVKEEPVAKPVSKPVVKPVSKPVVKPADKATK